MKIKLISDTHGQAQSLGKLAGDVLIHCGDMFNLFKTTDAAIQRVDDWFGQQEFDLILCIGGNHDLELEQKLYSQAQPFKNAIFLHGASYEFQGIKFYGAPWVPELSGQAFYKSDAELKDEWQVVPRDTDVLITHTPPFGVLDKSTQGMILGCKHLAKAVREIKPKLHCFGHVHASSGVYQGKHTTFINAAVAGRSHQIVRGAYEYIFED